MRIKEISLSLVYSYIFYIHLELGLARKDMKKKLEKWKVPKIQSFINYNITEPQESNTSLVNYYNIDKFFSPLWIVLIWFVWNEMSLLWLLFVVTLFVLLLCTLLSDFYNNFLLFCILDRLSMKWTFRETWNFKRCLDHFQFPFKRRQSINRWEYGEWNIEIILWLEADPPGYF